MKKTTIFTRLTLIVAFLSVYFGLEAATYYVRPNGSTAWGNITGSPTIVTLASGNAIAAFTDINAAATGADTYYFAKGTYNINFTFAITTGKVYGGFSGTETSTSNLASRAIFDVDLNGIVEPWEFTNEVTFTTSLTNGNYSGSGVSSRMFTVSGTGGEVNGVTFFDYGYVSAGNHGVIVLGDLTLTNTASTYAGKLTQCIVRQIKNNASTTHGIVMLTNANSVVDKCLIEDCRVPGTTSSGTIFMNKNGGTISNSVIRNNYVKANGGGVWLGGTPAATVEAIVSNCAIYNNTSNTNGGAIRGDAAASPSKGIQVVNCTVVNNSTGTSVGTNSSIELINSGLIANTISLSDFSGEIRPNTTTNYIVNSVYGANPGSAIYPSTGNNNISGILDNIFSALYFKKATSFQGAVSNSVSENSNYTLTKKNEIKAANFQITNASSIAYTTPNATLPASFKASGGTGSDIAITTGIVPGTDINGESRNAIGAYNYKQVFTITTSVATADGTVGGGGDYYNNETATLTATATTSGKRFKNWTVDGNVVSLNKSYSFTVTANQTVVANFADVQTTYYVRPSGSSAWGNIDATANQIITATDGAVNNFNLAYLADNTQDGTATYYIAAGNYTLSAGGTALTTGKIYGGFSGSESSIDLNTRATSDLDGNGVIEPWELTYATVLQGRSGLKYAEAGSGGSGERLIRLDNGAEVNGVTLTDYNYGTYAGAISVGTPATNPTNDDDGKQGYLKRCIVRKIKSAIGVVMMTNSRSVVDQCLIEDCLGTTSYGAVYFNRYGGTLSNSVIRNNKATTEGGAIYTGNALAATDLKAIVKNCLIYNNEATTKGGAISSKSISSSFGGIEIVNTTIVNNNTGSGAAAVEFDGTGLIANSIVVGNTVADLYATSTTKNYINGVVYGTAGAGSSALTETNTVSGKTTTDMNFAAPTATTGYLGLTVDANYTAMRAARFVINNAASTAVSTTSLGLIPVKYSDVINTYSSVPTNDITGLTRTGNITLGAYQATLAVGASETLTVSQPTTLASLTVAAGGKLTINSGITANIASLTLQSDENGTATMLNSGTFTGTVTAQQYLGTARNWYVSSPVSSASAPSTNMDYYYEYMEGGNNTEYATQPGSSTLYWKGLSNGTTMEVGKGYIAKTNAGATVQFSGAPNNGDVTTSFNLTRNDAKGKGFNLVGNPYPSYIDWTKVAAANTNLENTYYYRTKNTNVTNTYTFVTWNGAGAGSYVVSNGSLPVNTSITRFIPPTQAFWVRVKSGTSATKMYFNNDMRTHRDDNGNLLKAPKANTRSNLRLQLHNGTESDEMLVYLDEEASNNYDMYDSPKMMNNSSVIPDLYTKANAERLVINGLNSISDNTELPLGFGLNTASTLKLKVTEMSNFPIGTHIYLRDKEQNIETELTPETEYTFSTSTATTNNESRFSLLFKAPGTTTGNVNAESNQVLVFVNAQSEIVINAVAGSRYSVYNTAGQQIATGKTGSAFEAVNHQLSNGVYVVKVGSVSKRVVVK